MSVRRDGRPPVGAGEPHLVRPRPQLSAPRARLNGCGSLSAKGEATDSSQWKPKKMTLPCLRETYQVLLRVGEI